MLFRALTFSEDHIIFGNKAYERSSKRDAPLPQGKIVKCGLEKNCRAVDSAGEALAMLQIGGITVVEKTATKFVALFDQILPACSKEVSLLRSDVGRKFL